jgi:hypothetical protein
MDAGGSPDMMNRASTLVKLIEILGALLRDDDNDDFGGDDGGTDYA